MTVCPRPSRRNRLTPMSPVSSPPDLIRAQPSSVSVRRRPKWAFFAGVEARHLVYVAVVAGAAFRLAQYLANVSLSLDESLLALNIHHRTFSQLFDQLDFNQAAPPGFLAIQKAAALFARRRRVRAQGGPTRCVSCQHGGLSAARADDSHRVDDGRRHDALRSRWRARRVRRDG